MPANTTSTIGAANTPVLSRGDTEMTMFFDRCTLGLLAVMPVAAALFVTSSL